MEMAILDSRHLREPFLLLGRPWQGSDSPLIGGLLLVPHFLYHA